MEPDVRVTASTEEASWPTRKEMERDVIVASTHRAPDRFPGPFSSLHIHQQMALPVADLLLPAYSFSLGGSYGSGPATSKALLRVEPLYGSRGSNANGV